MTTSSKHSSKTAPKPNTEHWNELIAILPERTVEPFADWMDEQLAAFNAKMDKYATKISVRKSLRG